MLQHHAATAPVPTVLLGLLCPQMWGISSQSPQGYARSHSCHFLPQPVMLKKLKLNGSMKTYKGLLELTPKKCPFHCRGLECKSRKSRNTQSNRQICPWITEWTRAKGNRVLPRECTGDSKHPLLTTQEKTLHMDITRWSMQESDWLYSLKPKMEKLYRISKKQDWELAQIMNS